MEHPHAATASLKFALDAEKLCVWPVNPDSTAYKLGLYWGVTLSRPGSDAAEIQIFMIKTNTENVARENNLKPNFDGPTLAAGGVFVMYCGFETPLLLAAVRKARESGKPVWQVCEENPCLLEAMANA